jgi:pseudouridine-5'-phosphate glycosidase/pseudouridine kinase
MLSAFTRPIPSAIENIIASQQQHASLTAQPRSVEPAYSTKAIDAQRKTADIVVAGALACDYSCDFAPLEENLTNPQQQTSNPATIRQSLGGVAHNVAKAAHYIGGNVKLISLVGNDLDGNSARDQLASEGMRTDGVEVCKLEEARTARYVAVNDAKKDLVVAMADMNLLNTHGPEYMQNQWKKELQEQSPNYFVADANWEPHLLLSWFKTAKAAGSYTAYEPVSVAKGSRLFTPVRVAAKTPLELTSSKQKELGIFPSHDINLMAPNAMELAAIHSLARDSGVLDKESWWAVINEMNIPSSGIRSQLVHVTSPEIVDQGIPQQAIQLLPFVPCIITKLGSEGVLLAMLLQDGNPLLRSPEAAPYIISRNLEDVKHHDVGGLYMRHYPPVSKLEESQIVSVNGVGDTFLGALISAMNATGRGVEELVDFAQRTAVLTLQSPEAVSTRLRELSIDDEL